jgi:hypothetical protein
MIRSVNHHDKAKTMRNPEMDLFVQRRFLFKLLENKRFIQK